MPKRCSIEKKSTVESPLSQQVADTDSGAAGRGSRNQKWKWNLGQSFFFLGFTSCHNRQGRAYIMWYIPECSSNQKCPTLRWPSAWVQQHWESESALVSEGPLSTCHSLATTLRLLTILLTFYMVFTFCAMASDCLQKLQCYRRVTYSWHFVSSFWHPWNF